MSATLQSHWTEWRTDGHSRIYRVVDTPVPLNRVKDQWTGSHLPRSLHSSPIEQSEGPMDTVASTAQSTLQSHWTEWRTDGRSRIYHAAYTPVPLKRVKDRWTQSHLPRSLHSSPTEQSEGPMDTVASTAQSTLQSHWTEWRTDGHSSIYLAAHTPVPLNRVKDPWIQSHLPHSLHFSPTE